MIVTKTFPATKTINNVFDELFKTFPTHSASESNSGNVLVNINETEKGYNIAVNAPGRSKEAFSVNLENGMLIVAYKQEVTAEAKELNFVRKEFSTGTFKRSFNLDDQLNADGIEAKYENGILNVFVPKKPEERNTSKQILIQ